MAQTSQAALPSDVKTALIQALNGPDGEYAARATYDAIIKKFGNVQPYKSIIVAEGRHIQALQRQLRRYNIPIPKDNYRGKIKAPKSLKDAAKEGVAAEKKNVAMFDALLPKVKKHRNLTRVFTNLRRASKESHLPAFQRALENSGSISNDIFARLVRQERKLAPKYADEWAWPAK
jgi:hypothetical protein